MDHETREANTTAQSNSAQGAAEVNVAGRSFGSTGVWWRVGATAGLVTLCVLSTVRGASGAFEPANLPVAELMAQNGIITGTTRMMGNHFLLYNGTRLESMAQSMEVNFERGGSMTLCPRSQLQILTANQNSGMMLAFQAGGAQLPFPLRMGDEVLTPDWRVELTSDARQGDMGIVQVVTNRHGDLCLQGNSQSGAYFRVSQLIGDESYRVAGGQSERFIDGRMETSSDGCGCNAEFQAEADTAPMIGPGALPEPAPAVFSGSGGMKSTPSAVLASNALPSPVSGEPVAATPPAPAAIETEPAAVPAQKGKPKADRPKRNHPEDLAGYFGALVHRVFGR